MLRTVQFWRLVNADGSDLTGQFPAKKVVKTLQEAAAQGQRRHRLCKDGTEVLAEGLGKTPHPHIAMYRTRRVNLPRLEDDGAISPMPLTDKQALAEATFFVFLPNNVVALLFNNEGPRAGRFVDYLRNKLECPVGLVPILREDLAEVLDEMRVTAIDVSIPAAQVTMLAGGDEWAEALNNARQLMHDGAIQVKVSIGRGGSKGAKQERLNRLKELLGSLRSRDDLHAFSRAKAYGTENGTSSQIAVDLLEQKFIARVEVAPEDPAAAANASKTVVKIIDREWKQSKNFLDQATPSVDGDASKALVGGLVEHPEDEQ